jgi:hypothetical protein
MSLNIKNILSPEAKARLLWCLALQAQGPSGALAFTPPAMRAASPAESSARRIDGAIRPAARSCANARRPAVHGGPSLGTVVRAHQANVV